MTTLAYDMPTVLKQCFCSPTGNGINAEYEYAYDDNGNIFSITPGAVSVTYEYNGANELIRENNAFTNARITNRVMSTHSPVLLSGSEADLLFVYMLDRKKRKITEKEYIIIARRIMSK